MPAEPPVKKARVNAPKAGAPKAGAAKAAAAAPPWAQPAKAKLAAKAKPEPPKAAPKAPAVKVKLTKPVVDMIKWMNDHGELGKELRLGAVAVQLAALSQEDALDVLEACLDFPSGRRDPIPFVKEAAKELAALAETNKQAEVEHQHIQEEETLYQRLEEDNIVDWTVQGEESSLVVGKCPPLKPAVLEHVDRLTHVGALPKTTESDKLGAFLAFLGEGPAVDILSDFGEGPAIDPKEYITRAATPILAADRGSDFARRVSQRMRWMNFNLGLLSPLDVSQAAFELAWIGEKAALQVLKRLAKGASVGHLFADPTDWICREARILSGEEKRPEEKKEEDVKKDEAEKEKEVEPKDKENEQVKKKESGMDVDESSDDGSGKQDAKGKSGESKPERMDVDQQDKTKAVGAKANPAPATPPLLLGDSKAAAGAVAGAAPATPPQLLGDDKAEGASANVAPGTPPGTPPLDENKAEGAIANAAPGTPPLVENKPEPMEVDQESKKGEGQPSSEGKEPQQEEEDFTDVPIA